MNTLNKKFNILAAILLLSGLLACERTRTVDEAETTTVKTEEEDTAVVARTGETTEDKLEKLRSWMNDKKDRTDTAIRKEWPQTREELRRINKDIEENFDSLSAESKEEYRQLKSRYESWEARQDRRQQQPLDAAKLKTWQDQLLREYKDISKIEPANIREAYLTFMGTVRTKRRSWTQNDWDYVDNVYSSLNERRGQIEGQIGTADKLKIRSLQAEYLTLEGAADTQNMVRGVDEK
ncbi:hypothetical protein H8S95_02570 [Pontibacter sp. KCTC 32443]|uniref:hypothetical protein n=1 Tax=Pontibacter TaxID=323449 RepID=UPI00164D91FF|nr:MULTISPECIES: hypothetical protein [Pontibacter]MBC5772933.1 hypothetical protein [Pontibacter sp. KCTC 32443]